MICNIYTCTMESAKYYWGKSTTTKINREVHHSHGQNITAKMLILSNWSTDAINSNQNPSRIFFRNWQIDSKLYENAKVIE